jgi:protein-S-isoprenylcysteine O-methyltransferase Ste14
MVAFAALVFCGNAVQLLRHAQTDDGVLVWLPRTVGSLLTIAFYSVLIVAYLRRGDAKATVRGRWVRAAALVATALPFCVSIVARPGDVLFGQILGSALLVSGLAWSVWSLRSLDRSISVVPQARELVGNGPYRFIRHPLYVGEIVAVLGMVVRAPGAATMLCWVALVVLQIWRASAEERLLVSSLTGYDAYLQRTARLVPGLY